MPISFEYGLVGVVSVLLAGFIGSLFCHRLERIKVE